MKRVASLYLPYWPIERLRQEERPAAPPERAAPAASTRAALTQAVAEERKDECSVPRDGHWRPGARWARAEVAAAIEALPAHQRPPVRELGRRSEAADNPFKTILPELGSGRGTSREAGSEGENPAPAPPFSERSASPSKLGEGFPLVTSARTGSRVVIAAACPHAQALGLHPGMAVTQARALVSGLDVRDADGEGDRAALPRLGIAAARRWTPLVAVSGDDGLFLDITGVSHLFGGELGMARRMVRLLARLGFTARIAIADTAGAAHALVRHGAERPLLCPPGAHPEAIAALPVAALRIEPRAVELLRRLGIDRIGQLAAVPRAPLARRFGAEFVARLDQALGILEEPFDPVIPPERIRVDQRFAEPIATAEAILHWLGRLVPPLATALAQTGEGARAVELVAERVDGVPQRIRVGLARPSRDAAHILRLLARRIETVEPGYGIDALSLHVRRAERLEPQALGVRLDGEVLPDLAPLIDTLATRIGMERLWRAQAVESDVPERSVATAGPLDFASPPDPRLKPGDVRQLARNAALQPWHPRWPRPARLLHRPEPVDHVMAELPDNPPRRFTWRGTAHRVVHADGPERIYGEWWKRAGEAAAVRDYFRVEDESGQRFWLFRRGDGQDGGTGDMRWFVQGLFG